MSSDPRGAKSSLTSETTFTLRDPPYTYLHLSVRIFSAHSGRQPQQQSQSTVDQITIHQHLTSALHSFLGITGTAIPIDILQVEGNEAWIRVPREDGPKVVAAVSSWSGKGGERIGIEGSGSWLGGLSQTNKVEREKLWSMEI